MRRKRKRRPAESKPKLTVAQILAWVDAHHQRTGQWPNVTSGAITGSLGEKWRTVDGALRHGFRGLPSGSSLARLLAEKRGVRNPGNLPRLSVRQIVAWVDAHRRRLQRWPTPTSGPIADAPGETWLAIHRALVDGTRGLPGGSSLALLLAKQRGKRHHYYLSRLTVSQILTWADTHFRRTAQWPTNDSGPVQDAPGETWLGLSEALRNGRRGLRAGSSLARLLAEHRGVPNRALLPRLTVKQILARADAHFRRTGRWPVIESGPVHDAPGETWAGINNSLSRGLRGLPGGVSLAQLLAAERGKRNHKDLPRLTRRQILVWADQHFQRTGQWPNRKSGPILDAPGEKWANVNAALEQGGRGLPGGSSLSRLMQRQRKGKRGAR
jgi:hypothetical protein